jgi:hypothetical protein
MACIASVPDSPDLLTKVASTDTRTKVSLLNRLMIDIVYNLVYRLDLKTFEWTTVKPVPNSLPPPTKRCGHSAALWRNHIIIIYGGETDTRAYPNDLYAFNTRSHTWTQLIPRGPVPEPRSRAAVVLVDDLLYICGGTNENGKVLDDIVILDLGRMVWRKAERFECRYDHTAFYHDEKIYIYGGLTEQMNRSQDLLSFHLPTSTRTLTRIAGPATPGAGGDGHFYYPIVNSPTPVLLDFVMPVFPSSSSSRRKNEPSVSALDLSRMHWMVLESTPMVKESGFVWENLIRGNCSGDGHGKAYFIGYPGGLPNDVFSHVLEVDLATFGIVVNDDSNEITYSLTDGLSGIAKDLAHLLNDKVSCDFIITTDPDPDTLTDSPTSTPRLAQSALPSRPEIHCHTLILQARWPHFRRLMSAKMQEYHTHTLSLPEPYTVITSLIQYFYTDRLPVSTTPVIARLLVLSNLYQISRLRILCLGKLLRDLNVEHATTVWCAAREADERGLERRAGKVCFENFGQVVRTKGFRSMRREDVLELCGLVGRGAKVVETTTVESEESETSEIEEDGEGLSDEEDEGDMDAEVDLDEEMEF